MGRFVQLGKKAHIYRFTSDVLEQPWLPHTSEAQQQRQHCRKEMQINGCIGGMRVVADAGASIPADGVLVA